MPYTGFAATGLQANPGLYFFFTFLDNQAASLPRLAQSHIATPTGFSSSRLRFLSAYDSELIFYQNAKRAGNKKQISYGYPN